jgi:excisionase family DNA binding protein
MPDANLLSMKDFCARFGTGRTKAYELIHAGLLEAVKSGPKTLIRAESAERWANSLPPFGESKARHGGRDD